MADQPDESEQRQERAEKEKSRETTEQPAPPVRPQSEAADRKARVPATQPATKPAERAVPVTPDYLTVLERFESDKPAWATGQVEHPMRLAVETSNVSRIRIDRTKLPFAAGRSVALRIDGQGIEMTGRLQRVELVRSRTGAWSPVEAGGR